MTERAPRGAGFPFAHLSVYPSILLISPPLGLALEGGLISPLEASIQRLAGLSTDITNFTFHPFSASNEATTTTASRRGPALQPLSPAYVIIPFFREEAQTRFFLACLANQT